MRITFSVIIFVLTIFIFSNASNAKAAAGDNISGYAWSENIGWISFNCTNNGTCATSNYGVNLDVTTKNLSGFAWSDSIGWISFNAANGCPAGACQPRYDSATGEFLGWARVLSWDGWISLNCANGGCGASNYKVSLTGNDFVGWAWEDDVIGWISFNSKNCDTDDDGYSEGGAGCPPAPTLIPSYKVYFSGTCGGRPASCPSNCSGLTYNYNGSCNYITGNCDYSTQDCSDTNVCTDNSCNAATGCSKVNNTNSCNDGNTCTNNDVCSVGVCAGVAEVCGNTVCRAGCETPATCPTDCLCGNGIIDFGEVCDKNGDVGCVAPNVCNSICSTCLSGHPGYYKKFNRPIVDIFNDTAKFLLSIVGGIALLVIIIAGVYYITSSGSSERQEKAKKMIIYCLFGIIIVLVSYGILVVIERIAT